MSARRVTTARQFEVLLDFLEEHRDLALGRLRSIEYKELSSRLWVQISVRLNAEGPARSAKEWQKIWNDYKCRVRGKLAFINRNCNQTGGGPSCTTILSGLEERAASIIGRDFGAIPGVQQNQFCGLINMDEAENVQEVEIEEDFDTLAHVDQENVETIQNVESRTDSVQSLEISVPLILPSGNQLSYRNSVQLMSPQPQMQPSGSTAATSQPIPNYNLNSVQLMSPQPQMQPSGSTAATSQPIPNYNLNSVQLMSPQPQMQPSGSTAATSQPIPNYNLESGLNRSLEEVQRTPSARPRATQSARARARARLTERPRARPAVPGAAHVSHVNNLEESRAMIARIEEKRAQTDLILARTAEIRAQAELTRAQAAQQQAAAFTSMAASARSIARCIRRLLARSTN